jgi:ribosomal protein S18 acetylase RimI-like enzyme
MVSDVGLRPMGQDELTAFIASSRESYVMARVEAGERPDVAERVAERQHRDLFPAGRPAKGHKLFVVEAKGHRVGIVWVGPHPNRPDDERTAWLWDIEIASDQRGRGYGRAALAMIEDHLAAAGVTECGLNVFANNKSARRLYTSAGWRELSVTMTRQLRPHVHGDQGA